MDEPEKKSNSTEYGCIIALIIGGLLALATVVGIFYKLLRWLYS